MMYLLFWLLNIAWIIVCIFLCIKATKYIKERFGVLIAMLFVFFLLSFASQSSDKDSHETLVWKPAESTAHQNASFFKDHIQVPLEENFMFAINLNVTKGFDKDRQVAQPLSAFAGLEGATGGYVWEPKSIILNTDGNKATYEVHATMKWRLFGIFEYSQPKVYKGTFDLK